VRGSGKGGSEGKGGGRQGKGAGGEAEREKGQGEREQGEGVGRGGKVRKGKGGEWRGEDGSPNIYYGSAPMDLMLARPKINTKLLTKLQRIYTKIR
jgi:hypothetical protein